MNAATEPMRHCRAYASLRDSHAPINAPPHMPGRTSPPTTCCARTPGTAVASACCSGTPQWPCPHISSSAAREWLAEWPLAVHAWSWHEGCRGCFSRSLWQKAARGRTVGFLHAPVLSTELSDSLCKPLPVRRSVLGCGTWIWGSSWARNLQFDPTGDLFGLCMCFADVSRALCCACAALCHT